MHLNAVELTSSQDIALSFFGWMGTIFLIVTCLPQLYQLFRHRSVEGLSLTSYFFLYLGSVGWTLWGTMLTDQNLQIILTNTVCAILSWFIVIYIIFKTKMKLKLSITWWTVSMITFVFLITWTIYWIVGHQSDSWVFKKNKPHEALVLATSIFSGLLTSTCFLPQTLISIKTKNVKNTSLLLLAFLQLGQIGFFMFASLKAAWGFEPTDYVASLIFGAVSLVICSTMIYLKIKLTYFVKQSAVAEQNFDVTTPQSQS